MSELAARELMARRYSSGTTVANCLDHAHVPIAERPDDCELCRADMRDALVRAHDLNEWLNRWRDDALTVLTRQEAALLRLTGWEVADELGDRGLAGVIRGDLDDGRDTLVEGLPAGQARLLVEWLEHVAQVADGVAPLIDTTAE